MPANIAHMIIAHHALKALKTSDRPELAGFANLIDDDSDAHNCRAYTNLGSVGPDLFYYSSISKSIKDMVTEGFVQAAGVTAWSYHLHSCRPNQVPLNLLEVVFSDVIRRDGKVMMEDQDLQKIAYIAGHLTHIAADQIIHPLVNQIAGPYYRDGENRRRHRQAEVFQDYYLYEELYRQKRLQSDRQQAARYDFFSQNFASWVDCIKGLTTRNTTDWFRYFLQRGLVQCYGMFPSEDLIEDAVDNLLLTLKTCLLVGPYKDAAKEYQAMGDRSPMYRRFIKDIDYLQAYQQAVRLAKVYLIALYEVHTILKDGKDFTDRHRARFCSIISGADLSCPLEAEIVQKAIAALCAPRSKGAIYRKVVDAQ
ncbi:MAG: zinc dependent phospholipase C family protein [Sedimentisphaerales bacterium]|jgi:hypothetical protein|nr:zinc dependent phospholipase C family protein [Sedimentisphaerales bacterium]